MAVPEVCVVYLVRETESGQQVLLGRKKTGLGRGKYVGPGGKLEVGESPVEAAVREVLEEVGIRVAADSLTAIAELVYLFPSMPSWTQKSWAFVARDWVGEETESDELRPMWFDIAELPFAEMWDDAKYWLDRALSGEFVEEEFQFGPDNQTVDQWKSQ